MHYQGFSLANAAMSATIREHVVSCHIVMHLLLLNTLPLSNLTLSYVHNSNRFHAIVQT
jgi:hypothetical protein